MNIHKSCVGTLCTVALLCSGLACDKLPSRPSEDKSAAPASNGSTTPSLNPQLSQANPNLDTKPAQPTQPSTPPARSAAEILAAFHAMTPDQIGDPQLIEVGNLTSGLEQIVSLTVNNPQVTNAGLAAIGKFTELKQLNLSGCRGATAAGFVALNSLSKLLELDLSATNVGDAGLAVLKSFPNLQKLSLQRAPITDTGLANVASLVHLKELNLAATQISDQGFVHLAGLGELEVINVSENRRISGAGFLQLKKTTPLRVLLANKTQFGPAGLQAIAGKKSLEHLDLASSTSLQYMGKAVAQSLNGMINLKHLDLSYNDLSSAAMERSRSLKKLEWVSLKNAKSFNFQGLKYLRFCKNLTHLNIDGTQCRFVGGVDELKKSLPKLEIHLDGKVY